MNFHIRISRSYDEVKDWIQNLKGESIIVYQHEADTEVSRTHVHLLLMVSGIKPDAMKARFKTLYGSIEKTDWMFAVSYKDKATGEQIPITQETASKCITYMSKGKLTPCYSVGYDPDIVLQLTQKWVEPVKKLTTANGKFIRVTDDVAEKPKKTKRTLIEVMLDRGKDQDLDGQDTRKVLAMIRQVLIENNEVVGMWKVMEYYDAWMMYGQKDLWINMIATKIENRNSK